MGAGVSLVTEHEISELAANTNFTAKEIPKLLSRFSRNDPRAMQEGITLKDFLNIPEISTNPVMPKVAAAHLSSGKITASSFINMLSKMSPRSTLDNRKQFAFQVLDGDGDGFLSYTDLFGLYRLITGPTFRDDDVLSIIASILNGQELQQPGKISFDEFVELVSDGEIEELFTVELQLLS